MKAEKKGNTEIFRKKYSVLGSQITAQNIVLLKLTKSAINVEGDTEKKGVLIWIQYHVENTRNSFVKTYKLYLIFKYIKKEKR